MFQSFEEIGTLDAVPERVTAWRRELKSRRAEWAGNGIRAIRVMGDAEAPGPIAWATYAGHRYARELDEADIGDALPFRREVAALSPD